MAIIESIKRVNKRVTILYQEFKKWIFRIEDLEDVVNSENLTNNFVPVFRDGKFVDAAIEEVPDTEVIFDLPIRTTRNSVSIGLVPTISEVGQEIVVTNSTNDRRDFFVTYQFDYRGKSQRPSFKDFTPEFDIEFQPSKAQTMVQPSIGFRFPPATRDGLGNIYEFDGNSNGEEVKIEVYIGTDDSTSPIINQMFPPLDGVTAYEFSILAVEDEAYFFKISTISGLPFSIKGDDVVFTDPPAGTEFVPYVNAIGHDSDEYRLFTELPNEFDDLDEKTVADLEDYIVVECAQDSRKKKKMTIATVKDVANVNRYTQDTVFNPKGHPSGENIVDDLAGHFLILDPGVTLTFPPALTDIWFDVHNVGPMGDSFFAVTGGATLQGETEVKPDKVIRIYGSNNYTGLKIKS